MLFFAFVLLFVTKIRFPPHRSLYSVILGRYNDEGLKLVRLYEKHAGKLLKTKADLDFLHCCQTNHLTPKFLRFKLYSRNVENKHEYTKYQKRLLNGEIESKKLRIRSLQSDVDMVYSSLKNKLSFIDFRHVCNIMANGHRHKMKQVEKTHHKKLIDLGLPYQASKLSPEDVIYNLSNTTLTPNQKTALSLGLDFCFNPTKLNYNSYFLGMENLYKNLNQCGIYHAAPDAPNLFRTKFKSIALQTYYKFKPRQSSFQKDMISALKELRSNKELIITKPDKGNGTVILERQDYIRKMMDLINDPINFKKLDVDIYKQIIKLERKNNRLVDKMVADGVVTSLQGNKLKSRGSRPGVMYGLPKVHKQNVPMRPILSMSGSFNYELSRYMVPVLAPLSRNEYTVSDSFDFVQDIGQKTNHNYVMASFDVKSLYTNVPVRETCEIVLNKLFPHNDSVHEGFNKSLFEKVLNNCIENFFLFNNQAYEQVDGLPMGNSISAVLANIFMSHHEQIWLDNCPIEFKPVMYRRYVDDTFLLFRNANHVKTFQDYLNKQHDRIQFTCEIEKNNSLAFLDCSVTKHGNVFHTSSYRKPTYTGLGMKFDSAISDKYKFNLIDCLIDRAYKINSTVTQFCKELQRLRTFFSANGFNIFSVERKISKKLDCIKNPKPSIPTANKRIVYGKIPFMSCWHNKVFEKTIASEIINEFFPHLNLVLIFTNSMSIARMFPFKDVVPKCVRSNVIYIYKCGICNSTYIGETARHYKTRVSEHMGISPLTGARMAKITSHIYGHFLETGHRVLEKNFSILYSCNSYDLQTSESIAIHELNPNINDKNSSTPLKILN